MGDVIYCPAHLNPSLQNIIDLLVGAKTPLYNSYINEQQRPPFDFEIMKRPLYSGGDGDSLIITCQPSGYQKLCIKVYPNKLRDGKPNGYLALNLFKNPSAMKALQEKKMIPPYHAVFSEKDYIYCIYDYVNGETLTSHVLDETKNQNTSPAFQEILDSIQNQLTGFMGNLLELGFYIGGLSMLGRLASDNIVVNSEGWCITDLNSIFQLEQTELEIVKILHIDDPEKYMCSCIVDGLKHAYTIEHWQRLRRIYSNETNPTFDF